MKYAELMEQIRAVDRAAAAGDFETAKRLARDAIQVIDVALWLLDGRALVSGHGKEEDEDES